MSVTRFDPDQDLIFLRGFMWGPRGARAELVMVLDTGAAITSVSPKVLDELGYSARSGEAITKMRSAVAEEPGYLIRVNRFRVLRHEVADFRVHAHDLPEDMGIHGLVGLNFLKLFHYEVRSDEGRVIVERIAARG